MNLHIYERLVRLPFSRVSSEFLRSETANVHKYITLPATCSRLGAMVNAQALEPSQRALFDAGDLLPDLAFYWMNLAAAIVADCTARDDIAALVVPFERLVVPLSVGDLCAQMASNPWKSAAQVFVIWGADGAIFKRTSFPVRCAGAAFPIVDGVGIGYGADARDVRRLNLFVDR